MTGDRDQSRAKALADPTRATIHRLLSEASHPLTVSDLAAATQIHRTAVGQHLALLRRAGLVERSVIPPSGRGRPGHVYRAVDSDPYRSLAGWLASAVRTGSSAREAGRSAAAELGLTAGDPVEAVLEAATRIGFDPTMASSPPRSDAGAAEIDIVLNTCPFGDVASTDPGTVCQLHLGIVEGIVHATGGATVLGLHAADPRRGGCRISLHRHE